jgi:hypothetical protein
VYPENWSSGEDADVSLRLRSNIYANGQMYEVRFDARPKDNAVTVAQTAASTTA